MSEQIKYEPVFGPQKLFHGAPNDAVIAIKDRLSSNKFYFFSEYGSYYGESRWLDADKDQIAMRRIIKTPVWTVADQLECRMPEVGAKFRIDGDLLLPSCNDRNITVTARYRKDNVYCVETESGELWIAGDVSPSNIKPIETPAEKAQRLRDEWKSNALNQIKQRHWTSQEAYQSIKQGIGDIYDAILSGELQAPKGGE